MEFMAYLLIFGIISAATSRQWLSPTSSYELLNTSSLDTSCRDGTEEEKNDAEIANYGKAATFSLSGIYRCERRIFEYGDRNSFINLIADTVPKQADLTARRIQLAISQTKKSDVSHAPRLLIDVSSEEENVIPMVASAYQNAISERMRTLQVLRQREVAEKNFYRLKVTVLRVDDPNLVLQTALFLHHNGIATEVSI